ncbi:MAG: site-specific integrase [Phycisphaerales bacterium]|jgi:integrase
MAFKKAQQRDKPEEVMLKDFCKDWLKTRRRELRPESVKLYKNTIARLLTYFGSQTLLCKITPRSAARFIAEMQRLDGKEGELSDWARPRALRHCRTMFETAVVWEPIPKDPFKNVKAPKPVVSPWHYLTAAEYKRLLEAAPSPRFKALYALAYTGGLRFGELYSLTWNHIDFEAGEVKIENRPATAALPPFQIKDYEARTTPLPRHTIAILEDLKTYSVATDEQTPYVLLEKRHHETVLAKWQKYQSQGRAWRNQDISNSTNRELERHLKHARIEPDEPFSIHTLRKSCIQNWANNVTNPKVTQRLAGHADLKTTMQYYCQVTESEKAQAALAIDNLLKKTDVKVTYGGDREQN